MSYILDALKKAEAERDPDTRASLALAQHQSSRQRLLLYGVIVALLVNAVVLVWLFFPESGPGSTASVPAATAMAEPPARPRSAVAGPGSDSAPRFTPAPPPQPTYQAASAAPPPRAAQSLPGAQRDGTPTAPATEGSQRITPPPSARDTRSRVTLAGLSPDARARFPELAFSTHIYADDPNLRAVVVNGTRLVEGDALAGMRVHEITAAGAVFAFEDQLVSIAVLEDWN